MRVRDLPWLFALEMIIICVGSALIGADIATTPAAHPPSNYTVEIDEQDGSAVVYVENYEAITEDKKGLRIRKKGEE